MEFVGWVTTIRAMGIIMGSLWEFIVESSKHRDGVVGIFEAPNGACIHGGERIILREE